MTIEKILCIIIDIEITIVIPHTSFLVRPVSSLLERLVSTVIGIESENNPITGTLVVWVSG